MSARENSRELDRAKIMRDRLMAYWQKRGYHGIKVWLGEKKTTGKGNKHRNSFYPIHSNIGPYGYPPREK